MMTRPFEHVSLKTPDGISHMYVPYIIEAKEALEALHDTALGPSFKDIKWTLAGSTFSGISAEEAGKAMRKFTDCIAFPPKPYLKPIIWDSIPSAEPLPGEDT